MDSARPHRPFRDRPGGARAARVDRWRSAAARRTAGQPDRQCAALWTGGRTHYADGGLEPAFAHGRIRRAGHSLRRARTGVRGLLPLAGQHGGRLGPGAGHRARNRPCPWRLVEAEQPPRVSGHPPVRGFSRPPQRRPTDPPRSRIMTSQHPGAAASHGQAVSSKAALLMGALGVVYGDIGTSPLYTLRACLVGFADLEPAHILGVLSILFWLLMLVVSFKYVTLILRADNRGEGGTLALLELAVRGREGRARWLLVVLGIFGAALFYGDSMITPAISVLSAIEGIGVVSHTLDAWIVPMSLAGLILLFVIQSRGTGAMGKLFGRVMALWFATLAVLGGWQVWQAPQVLQALNPIWALRFIDDFPLGSFLLLGAVVLALTGAEALYADMGHF